MVRRSRVVTLSVTNLFSSGTHSRRRCTLTSCQRGVLMFECDTLRARKRRFPVISLRAMMGAGLLVDVIRAIKLPRSIRGRMGATLLGQVAYCGGLTGVGRRQHLNQFPTILPCGLEPFRQRL